jgi:hypothetical protein
MHNKVGSLLDLVSQHFGFEVSAEEPKLLSKSFIVTGRARHAAVDKGSQMSAKV